MPSELAKRYRVKIRMDCDSIKFITSKPTVLLRSDLEDLFKQAGGRKKKAEEKEEKLEKPLWSIDPS